jgi:hypothetical protein
MKLYAKSPHTSNDAIDVRTAAISWSLALGAACFLQLWLRNLENGSYGFLLLSFLSGGRLTVISSWEFLGALIMFER